jgi:phosphoribosylformylglycinamidine synthase subunit PurQ / glutaminase
MKASVIVFPGSNCDRDVQVALKAAGADVTAVWHRDGVLPKSDLVVLPGGFSYGDYLRSGAMAAKSPIMKEVITFAEKGGHVLGICNGFQVLTETGLLPGALMRNKHLKFICKDVSLKVENTDSVFTKNYSAADSIKLPVAHHDGNYFADSDTLKKLEDENRIAFRYASENGTANDNANPNGSLKNIAGILSEKKNVLGLMPHPERASDALNGNAEGALLFASLVKHFS